MVISATFSRLTMVALRMVSEVSFEFGMTSRERSSSRTTSSSSGVETSSTSQSVSATI